MMRLSVRLSRNADADSKAESIEIEVECDDIVPSAEIEAWLVAWSAEVRTLAKRWVGPQPAEDFVTPPVDDGAHLGVRWDVQSQRYKPVAVHRVYGPDHGGD